MEFKRNNLERASSPYLKQHKDSPIWWQEWNQDVLDYAKNNNKVLLVSVGYATCHMCQVMAAEAFSDEKIAEFLNRYFVSIKVDREQRPDIDRFLMSVAISTTGTGGWPLNVFLSIDLKPITALTYAPLIAKEGMPSFFDVLLMVKKFYEKEGNKLPYFSVPVYSVGRVYEEDIIARLVSGFDFAYGGIGVGAKFPPYSQLLFILYYLETAEDNTLKKLLEMTLNSMLLNGLHDHLQGGFFRYCFDRQWSVPHFEKMLYDQAYFLWVYSIAYELFGKDSYRICVQKIIQCLEETFEDDGLFYSAHDSGTIHEKGVVYLWSEEELRNNLSASEYENFKKVYEISKRGNLEGKNHLIKKKDIFLINIEEKLLGIRKRRKQPFVDKKIITSLNCLVGVGLIHAYRYLGDRQLLKRAEKIFKKLINGHYKEGKLFHSSINGLLQKEEFLEDYAALLLLITFLHEETGEYINYMKEFYDKLFVFKRDSEQWIESDNADFIPILAENFDYSLPSSTSLANLAVVRADILLEKEYLPRDFRDPLNMAFFNISSLIRNGYFYIIKDTEKLAWENVPINTIQFNIKELAM